MGIINRIQKIYWGGIPSEIYVSFVLFIAMSFLFTTLFPSNDSIFWKYGEYTASAVFLFTVLMISSFLTSGLNKFGGNVVSKFGRRVHGITAGIILDFFIIITLLIVLGPIINVMLAVIIHLLANIGLWPFELERIQSGGITRFEIYGKIFIILLGFMMLRRWIREKLGRMTQFIRDYNNEKKMGIGGSSKFIGMLEEWKHCYKPTSILLGTSLYEPGWQIGHEDDRHILTIGSPRSGKGRSAIIPNLLTWPYSAVVIDPKGGNAAVTSGRRGNGRDRVTDCMGQDVHVIDPFNINGATAHFNPLSVLNPQSFTIAEDIKIITEALVPSTNENDQHWTNGTREMINMIIGHELTKPNHKADPTLLDVRRAITSLDENALKEMLKNDTCGGLIQRSAERFHGGWDTTEVKNIKSGAASNTDWFDSQPMQQALSKTDFEIGDLKRTPKTIYLVLPTHYLDVHKRFLRLFINVTMDAVSKAGMGGNPVLFILDEFYALGRIDGIVTKAATLPEAGVKLWPIIQNIGQIKELYGQNMEGILSGVGILQVIGTNDQETEQWISSQLGNSAFERTIGGETNVAVAKLREPSEIGKDLARRRGKQFVMIAGENPMMLGRVMYDKDFPESWWNLPPGRGGIFEPSNMEITYKDDKKLRPVPTLPSIEEMMNTKVPPPNQSQSDIFIQNFVKKSEATIPPKLKVKEPTAPPKAAKFDASTQIITTPKIETPEEDEVDVPITAFEELETLIGLEDVKSQVAKVMASIKNTKRRREAGKAIAPISNHLVFTGNPGTGKTTVAKIIGDIYKEAGLLRKGHLIQANREKLVSEFSGQSATKTQTIIDSALDGILFIDEAYSLTPPNGKEDYGAEVISTLLEAMENKRNRLIVIVAGYSKEMQRFLSSNPGLQSRFKTIIDFPDYNSADLYKIFNLLCDKHDYALSKPATKRVKDWLNQTYEYRDDNFGNGRTVRNFFESCLEKQAIRLGDIATQDLTVDDYSRLEPTDIPYWDD